MRQPCLKIDVQKLTTNSLSEVNVVKIYRCLSASVLLSLCAVTATAGIFDDEEARKAILDLRQRVEDARAESGKGITRLSDDAAMSRRSFLELQNQIEALYSEVAKLRGSNEQLARDVAEVQRQQAEMAQGVNARLRQFEPAKVTLDGREFMAEPAEKKDFEAALAIFRKGDFVAAQVKFLDFLKRYVKSGYAPSALFWLANAQYATRDYKEAVTNFRSLLATDATHMRAPDALLSIANCQVELKDVRSARKTLEELLKTFPQSEAAGTAKERLAQLK
jgi:tol-pal system protein YbgF